MGNKFDQYDGGRPRGGQGVEGDRQRLGDAGRYPNAEPQHEEARRRPPQVTYVSPPLLGPALMQIGPFLEGLLREAHSSVTMVVDALHKEKAQLWLAYDSKQTHIIGMAVTEIQTFPKKRVLFVVAMRGKQLCEWQDEFAEQLQIFGAFNKVDYIEFITKRKADRFITQAGFKQAGILYRMECHGPKRIGHNDDK